MEGKNIEVQLVDQGDKKVSVTYSKYLDDSTIKEMEKIRKHSGNYITLFLYHDNSLGYVPYFGSCQTDNQLRMAINTEENLTTNTDSQGYPAMEGFAGSVPLSKDGRVLGIFLNSRGGELTHNSNIKEAMRSVASKISKNLFSGNSISVVIDRQQEYFLDPNNLNIFKKLTP